MKYVEVIFQLNPWNEAASDILAAFCGDMGFETFVTEGPFLKGYIQKSVFDEQQLRDTLEFFPMPEVAITYSTADAEDKDWNEEWEKNGFEPIIIGSELTVQGTGHDCPSNTRYEILLDPKMAFGTGSHETTYMILEQLLTMDLNGKEVLDAGCGTGVLGIMTALKGAASVMAYDIDEWSVNNTRTNCALNHVENITVHEGDASVLQNLENRFDLVLANINRNILLADMPHFVRVLKSGGQLILSGFYTEDVAQLVEAAQALGLEKVLQKERNGWACLLLVKQNSGLA